MNPMAEGVDWVQRAAAGEEARKSQSKASQSQPENFPVVPVLALTARSTQQAAEARGCTRRGRQGITSFTPRTPVDIQLLTRACCTACCSCGVGLTA